MMTTTREIVAFDAPDETVAMAKTLFAAASLDLAALTDQQVVDENATMQESFHNLFNRVGELRAKPGAYSEGIEMQEGDFEGFPAMEFAYDCDAGCILAAIAPTAEAGVFEVLFLQGGEVRRVHVGAEPKFARPADAASKEFADALVDHDRRVHQQLISNRDVILEAFTGKRFVRGDTYPHREAIKQAGGVFHGSSKSWYVPAAAYEELAKLCA